MRNLLINQRTIYALNYKGKEKVVDNSGNSTGESIIKYYPPQTIKVSISGARGSSQSEIFGTDVEYDKTLCLSARLFDKYKIDENTVFFIGKRPVYQDGTPLYNYRVSRIAVVINDVVIAVKEVRSNVNK